MRAFVLVALVACGDAEVVVPTLEATSGTRIKLEQYLFVDGTRQVDPRTFYDARLHTRCVPGTWSDGEERCIPLTSDAVYMDAECNAAVGVVRVTPEIDPAVYIGYEYVEGVAIPSRLFRANAVIPHVPSHYLRRDGQCVGPIASPPEAVFVSTSGELPASNIALVYESEAGSGRLGVRLFTTDDGLSVPATVHDRVLGTSCTPRMRAEGVVCEPVRTGFSSVFSEATCTEPAMQIDQFDEPPDVSRTDFDTCGVSYGRVEGEILDSFWTRQSGTNDCVKRSVAGSNLRVFRLGAPIDIAPLEHEVEAAPEQRRLAHVTVSDTDVRYTSELLIDRATRSECRRMVLGDVERCAPAVTVESRLLFDSTCTLEKRIVELERATCTPPAFATGFTEDRLGYTIHAIGDEVRIPLFRLLSDGCQPYFPDEGVTVHHVGPALPPETFPAAFRFGER